MRGGGALVGLGFVILHRSQAVQHETVFTAARVKRESGTAEKEQRADRL
jgi:hypothetical protein